MRVLYVEDDRDARQIFASRLKEDGYECETFDSADEALPVISKTSHDIIITDIQLPGVNGVEFIKQLREKDILTPCILITAFNSLEYAKSALNANANYLLEKPFTYTSLIEVIRKVSSTSLTVEQCVQRGIARLDLTPREKDIAQLVLKGLTNGDIAKVAELSEKTVKQHITQIFQKASVQSRSEFFSSIFPL